MILADKIIELRKKSGMSQEELAEKLGVSRQSVSKWESAQSTPDLDRILQMSELFSISTDILLKDEFDLSQTPFISPAEHEGSADASEPTARRVTMAEANEFLLKAKSHAVCTATGIAMIICSVIAPVIFDAVYVNSTLPNISVVLMFLLVAAGVGILIYSGILMKPFNFLSHEFIDTEYGIDGMVKEKKSQYQPKYAAQIVIGVAFCILSPIMPVILDAISSDNGYLENLGAAFFFLFAAAGVYTIVRTCIINGSYNKLLEEEGFSRSQKSKDKKTGGVIGAYWLIVTAVYLGYSFITFDWGRSWIIWVLGGILCPIVSMAANAVKNKKSK